MRIRYKQDKFLWVFNITDMFPHLMMPFSVQVMIASAIHMIQFMIAYTNMDKTKKLRDLYMRYLNKKTKNLEIWAIFVSEILRFFVGDSRVLCLP